ncbi:uncharacterized protein METZ01_LOCUS323205 [marine metagenome]|uniref:Uncharacterized protein n=1 Tax=marine metagenome TaxID=408172 RepID=A0A382PEP5_9ZZZZ
MGLSLTKAAVQLRLRTDKQTFEA